MNTARSNSPWLDQCILTARDLKHPSYSAGQLQPTPGIAVQRIRNSYNPGAPPKFRRVIRRIGPDGRVEYKLIQDERGVFTRDGLYAKPLNLAHDTSAPETTAQDALHVQINSPLKLTDNSQVQLLAPDSPVETQRSTERVRSLQALLGDQIAESHGKPPPRAAPFYASGAALSAEDPNAEPLTPVALPVG